MNPPDFPPDEEARLDALHAMRLLDTPPEERFDRLTRLASRVFDVPYALVSLVDSDRQWFKSCAGELPPEAPRRVSFCGHAILGDGLFVVPDTLRDERFADNPMVVGGPQVRFYAGCPLHAPDGSKIGSFCVLDNRPRQFSEADAALLRDLAAIADGELAGLHLATIDPLTGIANRRRFDQEAHRMLAMCRREQVSAALLFFDLDGFKAINDLHGHAAGDQALKAFATMLLQTFRASDLCARLGGDEFAVLVCGMDPAQSCAALLRLQRAVDAFNGASALRAPLAYSVGRVDAGELPAQTLCALMDEADRRMYAAKPLRPSDFPVRMQRR